MEIKIKKWSEHAIIPNKQTEGSAAYDLYAPFDQLVLHGRQVIDLLLAIELPKGYEAKVEPRSGYASKGFAGALDNTQEPNVRFDCDVIVGKIDSDYRGCIGVIVNNRDRNFYIKRGQRIAQLTIYRVEDADFIEVEELSETEREAGGFGHTGN